MRVGNEEALDMMRLIARREGVLVGISSGAALLAAVRLAKSSAFSGKTVVALLPDTGERYLGAF